MDSVIPVEFIDDPELLRRGRLISRFGVMGAIFGLIYAGFYLLIGHIWGVTVILICTSGVALAPWVMLRKKATGPAGHFLAFTLISGFTTLCFLEGGLHGHAIAWLVSVPLCALLLVGKDAAGGWAVAAFAAAGLVAGVDFAGIHLLTAYDPKWENLVSAAGYLGLILFMFILGLIFENGRAQAHRKMKSALLELAASNERLLHLNNEKTEFLGIAAHDLKNPLTLVIGGADLITRTRDYTQIHRHATMMMAAGRRMRDLITNLLDHNAIEEGRFTSKVECCDVRLLVEQCIDNNRPSAVRKGIGLRVGASEGIWAKADRAATAQILDNLLSNALKYSPPNTTVHVHTLPEKDFIVVSVRDEGPGISEEDQKKLFQKFTRLSARPTGGESSTGLGLSIVKRLAEAMSGSIQCNSTTGFGANFMLRLPVWAGAPPPPEASADSQVRVVNPATPSRAPVYSIQSSAPASTESSGSVTR